MLRVEAIVGAGLRYRMGGCIEEMELEMRKRSALTSEIVEFVPGAVVIVRDQIPSYAKSKYTLVAGTWLEQVSRMEGSSASKDVGIWRQAG